MAKPTRHGPHDMLNIFQDNFFENATPMISHAPMPSTSKPPRRPLQSSDTNIVLNPPIMFPATHSPLKPASQKATNPTTPLKAMQGQQLNMVAFKPPQNPMRPTDCIQKKQPFMSRFKTVAQKPVVEPGLNFPGNENAPRPILYQPGAAMNLSIENYYQKPKGKRLLEPAPIKDSRPQKKPRLEDSPLPPHDSFPAITDDGTKPGHSYATLIGMAILRSPHRRLTLSQIYKWISDTYSFYNPQDAGWQNSIRHNLSLNKAFVKQERPKDDPGKGNYWAIEPGMEHQFMKEKPTRKSAITAENLPVMTTLEPSMPLGPAMQEPALPPQLPVIAPSLPNMQPYHAPAAPLQHEPSSDATIPVSDSAAPEESLEKTVETEAPFDSSLYSPLPAAMHSSPPIPRHIEAHHGTPPPPPRQLGSSITRSHKRKFASMDDSGYISSLESSVLRGNQHAKLLTSEADRPRIKRGRAGRAEEEIARLRASSYDSPSKGRSWNGLGPQSSSPLRQIPQNDAHQMRPPRTPAIKLKALPQPPPSNSPNTNLRIHRDKVQSMLQSPLRRIHNAEDDSNIFFTPNQQKIGDFSLDHHFNVDLGSSNYHGIGFDIHNDDMTSFFHDIESPIKRSAKRMRLDRTQSAGILGEVTNPSARKSVTSAPLLKVPGQSPAIAFDTPSKAFDGLMSSPSKFFAFQSPLKMQSTMDENDENAWNLDDFYSTDLIQDNDECSGLDILQGFEKIGASAQPVRPSTGVSKPALGRSYTTNF